MDWSSQVAAQVGERVAQIRKDRGMTAQALADRCAELGLALDRSVIAKLERGLRQTVSLAELLVLARALNVPPLRLALPIGQALQSEVLPGVTVDTWQAAQWFTGHEAFPATAAAVDEDDAWSDGSDFEEWRQGAAPVTLWRRHAELVARWHQATRDATELWEAVDNDRKEVERIRGMLAGLPERPAPPGGMPLGEALRRQVELLEGRAHENLRWVARLELAAGEARDALLELHHDIRDRGLLCPPLSAPGRPSITSTA
ncbi:helix-turn-helix domain-containing protein [Streptosporangium canum]|uniref:helix-turn-helix domain-containing protein n=1 Tax=Streptosporangium canum TaxID=324952 RepID=UPI0036867FED